jgi:hypothetical protein
MTSINIQLTNRVITGSLPVAVIDRLHLRSVPSVNQSLPVIIRYFHHFVYTLMELLSIIIEIGRKIDRRDIVNSMKMLAYMKVPKWRISFSSQQTQNIFRQ